MPSNLEEIKAIATSVRTAFESIPTAQFSSNTSLGLSDFPRGCCGDASKILAVIIEDESGCVCNYVCARNNNCKSHAWLELDRILIDITADQFNTDSLTLPSVLITHSSPWHKQFTIDKEVQVGVRSVFEGLNGACKLVKSAMGHR